MEKSLLRNLIKNSDYKVISFNIFNTLLAAPFIHPDDMLQLLSAKIKDLYGIEFFTIRKKIEKNIMDRFHKGLCEIKLSEIYNLLHKEYGISSTKCEELFTEEVKLIDECCIIREEVKEIYDSAAAEGKRIICICDSYLPGEKLKEILYKRGFNNVSEVYSSSDLAKSKRTGALYEAVLERENISEYDIFHIGDDYKSDFLKPIELHINASHYPSINEVIFSKESQWSKIWPDVMKIDAHERILIGFALTYYFSKKSSICDSKAVFNDLYSLGFTGIGPVLLYICQVIAGNKILKENFDRIFFDSVSGSLPKKAYDIITKKISAPVSELIHFSESGRIDDSNLIKTSANKKKAVIFTSSYIKYSDKNMSLSGIYKPLIISLFETDRSGRKKFFLKGENSYFLFKNTDKLSEETYYMELLFSELLQSAEQSISINKTSDEGFLPYSKKKEDIDTIQSSALSFIELISETVMEYLQFLNIKNPYVLLMPLIYAIKESPYNEEILLRNIVSENKDHSKAALSLSYKLLENRKFSNVFSKTGFQNDKYYISNQLRIEPGIDFKIGIHIHIYSYYLYIDIIRYLMDFPLRFDLIITLTDMKHDVNVKKVFNNKILPNLLNIYIIIVPNRGRDVAPWLIFTKEYQAHYDLFCHLHTKESKHFNWGNRWRDYLYRETISRHAFIEIFNLFANDKKLGLLFPPFFDELKEFCIAYRIDPAGEYNEEAVIDRLLLKMNINKKYERADIIYSGGTMLWYRPEALKPLFDLNLTINDFPPEPIGVGGTLAHVIERIPVIVCESQGYIAGMHMSQGEIFRRYSQFNSRHEELLSDREIIKKESLSYVLYLKFKRIADLMMPHGSRRRRVTFSHFKRLKH